MMDMLPTAVQLAGIRNPLPHPIDGKDISSLMFGDETVRTPHQAFYYYRLEQLQAVRSGRWKLYVTAVAGKDGEPVKSRLFDVVRDAGEQVNVAAAHPDVVRRLTGEAAKARHVLGDRGVAGTGRRPAGRVESPVPQRLPRD